MRESTVQAAWLYAQMVRWGQASISQEALKAAMGVFRPDLYDAARGRQAKPTEPSGAIGAFAGPAFDANDIAGHLAAFEIGHRPS
jgi:two-component system, oxyanion-binding sensor